MPTNKLELRHMRDGTPFVRVSLGRDPVTGRERRTQKSFPGMSDEEAMGAALEWYGHITGETLGEALRRYNGRRDRTDTNRYYSDEYAAKIVKRASNPDMFGPIEIKLAK